MSRLSLTFASCRYDRLEAIRDGDVTLEGVDLTCITLKSGRQVFDRMVGGREFDIAELSASEFISLHGSDACPFVALPVFPSRVFRHGYIFINTRSGIRSPRDLAGRRVGVPLYTQTAAIWARGHLQHEFGVNLESIRWIQGAVDAAGTHGKPHAPPLLKKVEIEQNESGEALGDLLARGAIDALIGSRKPSSFGRHPDVARLFPDYRAREREMYARTQIFPIMHLIAMRRDLYERHPWIATSFYGACVNAKRAALARMRYAGSLAYMLPWLQADIEEIDALFNGDAWPYGIEPNRRTLEALIAYMLEQGFIATAPRLEGLFVPLPGENAG
ncbi:MAG TPA: ABC transporter substrate-binding protein [Xanthobacteraceae bacterium]|nr:ABC transporter substrate-binding protein [Xanthobacteraceae bacterium]